MTIAWSSFVLVKQIYCSIVLIALCKTTSVLQCVSYSTHNTPSIDNTLRIHNYVIPSNVHYYFHIQYHCLCILYFVIKVVK